MCRFFFFHFILLHWVLICHIKFTQKYSEIYDCNITKCKRINDNEYFFTAMLTPKQYLTKMFIFCSDHHWVAYITQKKAVSGWSEARTVKPFVVTCTEGHNKRDQKKTWPIWSSIGSAVNWHDFPLLSKSRPHHQLLHKHVCHHT